VKGVTHCLLPGCSNPTWPFENYCGRTHAHLGRQQGIKPPLPSVDTSAPQQNKDSSLCIFPQCTRPKFVDGSTTHPYCGRTHAEQGKLLGIVRESCLCTLDTTFIALHQPLLQLACWWVVLQIFSELLKSCLQFINR